MYVYIRECALKLTQIKRGSVNAEGTPVNSFSSFYNNFWLISDWPLIFYYVCWNLLKLVNGYHVFR